MCIKPGIIIVQLLLSVQNLDVGGEELPWCGSLHTGDSSQLTFRGAFSSEPNGDKGHCLHSKPLTRPCLFGAVAAGALGGVRVLIDLLKAVR